MSIRNLILRISGVFIGTIITLLCFIIVTYVAEMNYKYLDYNDNWGVSYDCFAKEEQCYCHVHKKVVKVKQYYEVEKNARTNN